MIFILTGPVHSGKTTLVGKVVLELRRQGVNLHGFLSEACFDEDAHVGYNLRVINKKGAVPFIRKKGKKSWERVGPYFFVPQAMAQARGIILSHQDESLLVVDEVGPLEIEGGGLWPALEKYLLRPTPLCLMVIRETLLEKFLDRLLNQEIKVFEFRDADVSSIAEDIRRIAETKL